MVQYTSTYDNMKRLLSFLAIAIISISCYAQGTFNYCTMRNGIWGEWKSSENPLDSYLIDKINDCEWVIYRYCNHPSNYLLRLKINNFHLDNDKKSRKEHLKNNQWYEFSGSVEIFTDPETFSQRFPFVPTYDKPEIRNMKIPAQIRIEPYKKKIQTINIFFDEVGLGLGFR